MTTDNSNVPANYARIVAQAIAAMEAKLEHEWTVGELASVAMYSKAHFLSIFTRVTGMPPGQFLTNLRFEKAKNLLAAQCSVISVCRQLGYKSVGTFTSRFKELNGVTPGQYRRSACRNAEPSDDQQLPAV